LRLAQQCVPPPLSEKHRHDPAFRRRAPPFRPLFLGLPGTLCLVTAAFVLYVWSEKRIDRANQQRYTARKLVSELRHSSEDLTRMARSYVATGEPAYRRHYREILDIRDGRGPHPQATTTCIGTWCSPTARVRAPPAPRRHCSN
jgi:hypothetical protein